MFKTAWVPDPTPTLPTEVQAPIESMAGIMQGVGVAVAVIAVIAIGIAIIAGTVAQNQWARSHATGLGAVFGGLAVLGLASTIVGTMLVG